MNASHLQRNDDSREDLIDSFPVVPRLRSERYQQVLQSKQWHQNDRGAHRFAQPHRRRLLVQLGDKHANYVHQEHETSGD